MAERTLLTESREGHRVEVTTSRAVVDSTTYAVKNITSVSVARTPSPKFAGAIFALLGVLVGVFASGDALSGRALELGPGHLVAAFLGAIGLGILAFGKAKFAVRLHTAGVEQKMLESTDEAWIARVAAALNTAIVGE
jgi:hypothetical protein